VSNFAAKNYIQKQMRRSLSTLCILFSAIFTLGSCLSSDETQATLYDDAAISSFGISTAKLYVQTPDTTYWTTTTDVADYPFEIDQQKCTIINRDSLPVGVDPTKLLVTYSSKNSGTVGIMPVGETSRDSLKYLLTTDSLDFTTPRMISVYALDGSGYRDYTVTVNIHKEYGDSCYWSQPIVNASLATMKEAKAFCMGDNILVVGNDGTTTSIVKWNIGDASAATTIATSLGTEAYRNIAVMGNVAYILDNGKITSTSDFENYTEIATAPSLKQLIGAGSASLYATDSEGKILVSTDNGATWASDALDDDATKLPTEEIATICTTYDYSGADCDYMLLAGNRNATTYATDSLAKVWRKIDAGNSPKWVYIDSENSNSYPLKQHSGISLMKYGDSILELGKSTTGYTGILESRDSGITWKTNKFISLPDGFDGSSTSYATATTDSNNMIWIVKLDTGQIWKGRQNKMGWTAR